MKIPRIHFSEDGAIDGQSTLAFTERIRWIGIGPD